METTRLASLTSFRWSVAIRCRLRRRRPIWMKLEPADRFEVGRVREQVDEGDLLDRVAIPRQEPGVAAESGGVAAHEDHALRVRGRPPPGGGAAETGPRRI